MRRSAPGPCAVTSGVGPAAKLPPVNRTTRWLLPTVLALLVVAVLLGGLLR
jgi:hypothetical protein